MRWFLGMLVAARGFGVSGFRVQAEVIKRNVPDSQAAPVRPMIFAVVTAVDAIVVKTLIDVWYT